MFQYITETFSLARGPKGKPSIRNPVIFQGYSLILSAVNLTARGSAIVDLIVTVACQEVNSAFIKVHASLDSSGAKGANALLVLANSYHDAGHRSILWQIAGFHKNVMDMEAALNGFMACGDTCSARCASTAFSRAEAWLLSTLSRHAKMKPLVRGTENSENEQLEELKITPERMAAVTELADRARAALDEQKEYAIGNLAQQLQAASDILKPIAGGLPDGKSWKENVQAVGRQLLAAGCWQRLE